MANAKRKSGKKKYFFSSSSDLVSLTEEQLNQVSPETVFRLVVGTYHTLHRQLCSDAINKKPRMMNGVPVVTSLHAAIERVEEIYPGILSEIKKQNSGFILQC